MVATKYTYSQEKENKLKHVHIYNQLFHLIQNGTYPVGSQLPSEPNLATQLNVSRVTLRRALALLQEDHMIQNIRGKGNFVIEPHHKKVASDFFKVSHPMEFCSNKKWDDLDLEFRIEPPSDFFCEVLQAKPAAVVIIDRWYKLKSSTKALGYTLSFIPIEIISKFKLDLSSNDELEKFIQETLYNDSFNIASELSYTTTGNFTSTKYKLSDSNSFILITETISNNKDEVLIHNKHYIPTDLFSMQININRSKD